MVHAQHRGPDHALGADDSRFEPENGCIDAIPAQEGEYNDMKLSTECLSPWLDSLCDKEVSFSWKEHASREPQCALRAMKSKDGENGEKTGVTPGQMPSNPSEDAVRPFVTPTQIQKPEMVTPDQ